MRTDVNTSKQHNEFGRKILTIIAKVHPYVKHRLYTAETRGIIPHNMYTSSGIIDDSIVRLYEDFEGKLNDPNEIKLKLFSLISEQLRIIFKTESQHLNSLSTSQILEEELKQMEEKYEVDIDNDMLMDDELDDISYKQDGFKKEEFLYNDAEKNIINSLEIKDSRIEISNHKRKAFNYIYNWLPLKTSNILDLFVFGKLSYKEIACVKGVQEFEIKKIVQSVSNSFRKNIL
jgi:hypothetical protein